MVKNIFYSALLKEYKLLKAIFLLIASYLIFEEVYICFVLKPTFTSSTRRNIKPEDFPEIILCPVPPIDVKAARSRGYDGMDYYYLGLEYFDVMGRQSRSIGWSGYNRSESVKIVSEKISTIKSVDDCPLKSYLWYDEGHVQHIKYNLSKALYPYHVCCKVIPPIATKSHGVIGIRIEFSTENKSIAAFKMFMADQFTASIFDQNTMKMLGDETISSVFGINNYKVKILEEEKLEDDPNSFCIDYKFIGEYAQCLQNEVLRQNFHLMNCTPPWMIEDEDLWCDGKSLISKEYLSFLAKFMFSASDPGNCLVPCKTKTYQVKKIGLKESLDRKGLIIYFDKTIETTKSDFQIGIKSLTAKIGGFIGVSKNFLWLVILILSTIGLFLSNIKTYVNSSK